MLFLSSQALGQRLCLADRKSALKNGARGPHLQRGGEGDQCPGMASGESALHYLLLHAWVQLQKPQGVGYGGAGFAHPGGGLLLGHVILLNQRLVA